jgi:hypothetical protein
VTTSKWLPRTALALLVVMILYVVITFALSLFGMNV